MSDSQFEMQIFKRLGEDYKHLKTFIVCTGFIPILTNEITLEKYVEETKIWSQEFISSDICRFGRGKVAEAQKSRGHNHYAEEKEQEEGTEQSRGSTEIYIS